MEKKLQLHKVYVQALIDQLKGGQPISARIAASNFIQNYNLADAYVAHRATVNLLEDRGGAASTIKLREKQLNRKKENLDKDLFIGYDVEVEGGSDFLKNLLNAESDELCYHH